MLKRLLFGLLMLAPLALSAQAQSSAQTISVCGTPLRTPPVGQVVTLTQDPTGKLCVDASVNASISGFTAATTGTPITATTGGATGSLPAGAVVVVTNTGTTNAAYCQLGASASTSSQYISPGGGWFAFTVGANTQVTCATSTSTTTVNLTGGAGLPTGTGGGSGGSGGGGNVTVVGPLGANSIAASVAVTPATSAAWLVNPSTSANWGLGATFSAAPSNTQQVGGTRSSDGALVPLSLDASSNLNVSNNGTSEYPFGSTFVKDSDVGTTSSTVSSLPVDASQYNFVCSISARAVATAATTVNVTLSDGTYTENYLMAVPDKTLGIAGIVEMIFTPCAPTTAINNAWTLTIPAVGAGGVTSTAIKGYKKTTSP